MTTCSCTCNAVRRCLAQIQQGRNTPIQHSPSNTKDILHFIICELEREGCCLGCGRIDVNAVGNIGSSLSGLFDRTDDDVLDGGYDAEEYGGADEG